MLYSVLGVQCLVIRYAWINWSNSVCTALLIRKGVEKNSIQCLLDETASLLDDAEDYPSRWLYIQFAAYHPAPAPGQNHFPRPKSHLSLLYTTYEEVVDVVFIPAAGEGVEPSGADTVTGDTMIQILTNPEVYVSSNFSEELVDVVSIPAAGEGVQPLGADAVRDMLKAAMKC